MKTPTCKFLLAFTFLSTLNANLSPILAQSTAFTYQGRLAANGAPYSGFAEMQFKLFGASSGGVAIASSTPAIAGVTVSGGLFATSLDFGAAAFTGANRFLEIQVRTNVGAFIPLTPRQPVAPTPYALYARTAGTTQGPWVSGGSDLSYTGGRVGIGTDSPVAGLDVRGDIRLGVSGQLRATSGEENLRIIRGYIYGVGETIGDQGFTVTRISEGDYRIDFATPFVSTPTVTATVDDLFESLSQVHYYVAGVYNPNTASVRIRTRMKSATILLETGPSDQNFYFIAVGPR